MNKQKLKRLGLLALAICVLIGFVVVLIKAFGLDSLAKVQALVNSAGIWAYIIYFGLTWLFMLAELIPTGVIIGAGVLCWGLWQGILVSVISVIVGELGLFLLGRKFGVKATKWIAGDEDTEKWRQKLTHGKYTLFLLLLFPGSPDSLLCALAGTSNMSLRQFLLIMLLTKPIGSIFTALFYGGYLIPFKITYIWAWVLVGAVMLTLIWASAKYNKQIDNIVNKILHRQG